MKTQLHKFPFWFAAVLLALFIPACSEPGKNVDVQAQINLLKTGDENAKQDALVKLGEAKENAAPAIPAILDAMKDTDPIVRRLACYAIEQIGPGKAKSAIPAVKAMMNDPDQNVSMQAMNTLATLDPKNAPAGKGGPPPTPQ